MFTGLVEELGTVSAVLRKGRKTPTLQLTIKGPLVAQDAKIGDSIAINGCCLTVVKRSKGLLAFEAGEETLSRTNLGRLARGSRVNLERSLVAGDRLGGHLVAGHIDAQGTLLKRRDDRDWSSMVFAIPPKLTRQMASKGSVAVDGVSLTLVDVEPNWFSVALIPHTLKHTTLGSLKVGEPVNIETDLLAKYVERQLESSSLVTPTAARRA
jgi:riboflavin synthase